MASAVPEDRTETSEATPTPAASHQPQRVHLPPSPELGPPPAYDVAAQLPTYEESERAKGKLPPFDPAAVHEESGLAGVTLLAFPTDQDESELDSLGTDALLGNDFVFFAAFVAAFVFNWIGFLLLMCFCHTIAARYGALAGFGLSLTKWTVIVKRSTDVAYNENSWLWFLIMAFGLIICFRAIIQYVYIKRSWAGLSNAARERLFFFY